MFAYPKMLKQEHGATVADLSGLDPVDCLTKIDLKNLDIFSFAVNTAAACDPCSITVLAQEQMNDFETSTWTCINFRDRREFLDAMADLLLHLAKGTREGRFLFNQAVAHFDGLAAGIASHGGYDAGLAQEKHRLSLGVVEQHTDTVSTVEQVSILELPGAVAPQLLVSDTDDLGPTLQQGGDANHLISLHWGIHSWATQATLIFVVNF